MTTPIILAALLATAGAVHAQTPPAFDAASVKLLPTDDPTHRSAHASVSTNGNGARVSFESTTLKDLIQRAYGVAGFQIAGPAWLSEERYDVVATVASPVTSQQIGPLLRTLLEQRFQLTLHRETRVGPLYQLVAAKGGPKLRAGESGASGGIRSSSGKLAVKLAATNQTMANLVDVLAEPAGRPVVDKTGLDGVYNFELEYARSDDAELPSIFTAVEEQLGLKLQAGRGPVEMLVIDHAEKTPVAN
jgi:uncharacterized protein (TIGR03435 family)